MCVYSHAKFQMCSFIKAGFTQAREKGSNFPCSPQPTQLRDKGEKETMFLLPIYLSYHTFSAKISDAKTKYTVVNSGLHQPLK